jgi:hypothetical protein
MRLSGDVIKTNNLNIIDGDLMMAGCRGHVLAEADDREPGG